MCCIQMDPVALRISLVNEMNTSDIRHRSLKLARELGYAINGTLPLLDDGIRVTRDRNAIVDRSLCLYGTLSAAYGFGRDHALKWLGDQGLLERCTLVEREFLNDGPPSPSEMKKRVEGLYVLAWALGLYEDLDFTRVCPSDLVLKFPNIKLKALSTRFRDAVAAIDPSRIVDMVDLAFCVHWAVREKELAGRAKGPLPEYIVVERRRALEWLVSKDDFEDVALDT
jgi:hypothetical protein